MTPLSLSKGTYFGRSLRRTAIGPFELTETVYRPDEPPRAHRHDVPTLFIVLSGRLAELTTAGSAVHHPHTAVFNPSGIEHEAQFRGESPRILNIQFDPAWLDAESRPGPASRVITPRVFAAPAIARLRAALTFGDSDPRPLDRAIRELLAPRETAGNRPLARRAAALVERHQHLRERVTRVAPTLGVERTRLAHAFRREFGVSLQEYAARVRFAIACDMLEAGSEPLAIIAHAAGYADQSHMTRDFTRRAGVPPGKLRNRG